MSEYQLYNGDCFEVMETISDKSIDLVCCDPPYGTTSIEWDQQLDFGLLWKHYERIIKPKGIICLFGSQPFTSILVCSKLDWFRYELIWNKNKCGSPALAKYRPMKTHENIMVFFKESGGTYNPQMEAGKPFSRTSKNPEGYVSKRNPHGYGLKPVKSFTNEGTRYPKSVLNISRDFSAQQQVHPTQKPVPVMEWLIRTYSNEGDTIIDNCMGSGTTGVAARQLNRNFIGIEVDPSYFEIAETRINTTEPRPVLFE